MSWKEVVWGKAEEFRATYLKYELGSLPIDIVSVVELEMRLDMIPYDDLYTRHHADAAISADFTGIYVDAESYLLIDSGPEWKMNRLRFSIAHEVGHWCLHREEFRDRGFAEEEDFACWTWECGGRKYDIEKEANEFAGRLLVPVDRLRSDYEKFANNAGPVLPGGWKANVDVRRSAAEHIAQSYGVHPDAILVRFDRENIWPDPLR